MWGSFEIVHIFMIFKKVADNRLVQCSSTTLHRSVEEAQKLSPNFAPAALILPRDALLIFSHCGKTGESHAAVSVDFVIVSDLPSIAAGRVGGLL